MPDRNSGPSGLPDVSVIILVLGNVDRLLECVESVLRSTANVPPVTEVVVVANGTPQDQLQRLSFGENVRVLAVPANLGFAGGSNLGARFAQGSRFAFLNDDCVVDEGWLTALVNRADSEEDIGAVCSRLLNADRTLQEAGSVVWRNARTDRVGNVSRALAAKYQDARDVDSASACGLLVKREAWEQVGGFDEQYFPAYYEDVDLCFSLRDAGYRVVYEPESTLVHWGSQSTTPELRLFAAEQNAALFAKKWPHELLERPEFPGELHLEEHLDGVIKQPPTPTSSRHEPSQLAVAARPGKQEIEQLAFAALQREVQFQAAFIDSELERLNSQLASVERLRQMVRRIPGLRLVWRKTASRLR